MDALTPTLVRWSVRILVTLMVLGVTLALVLTGLLRALDALQLWLTPTVGEVGALLLVALLCLTPLILLSLLIWRWQRRLGAQLPTEQGGLRALIRAHPWETAGAAFVFGFSYRSDPQLSAMVLRESLQQLKTDATTG